MRTRSGNLHLEIQTSRKSPVGLIRSSFRNKSGKIAHSQHGRIVGCSLEQLKIVQAAFRGDVIPSGSPEAFRVSGSREYGASRALLQLARDLGLHRILYSRSEPWVDSIMAMIIGRIIYQGSKLGLCNLWADTCLWELCGIDGRPDVDDHCYQPLDRLLERQPAIQKKLAAKHLQNSALVLYDITSSYFEGEYKQSSIVHFGYNRDKKRGHEQIVIGLLCTPEGCPVGCEVFAGNTNDATTVTAKINELRTDYGLEKIVFVGDRGMVTAARLEELRDVDGLNTISALTHNEIFALLRRGVIQTELFDERNIVEVADPKSNERYCLCRNPVTAQRERKSRERLLKLSVEHLEKIASYKRKTTVEILGARIGKVLAKYKMSKFIDWNVEVDPKEPKSRKHKVVWSLEEEKIEQEKLIDGCYIIRTDVSSKLLDEKEVVKSYKDLGNVERAFRSLKTTHLEIRPVYHKTDDRIRAHVFLCMLAYYVQWHMVQRLRPLFEADGEADQRRWTVENVIKRLTSIRDNQVEVDGIKFNQISEINGEPKQIIDMLQIAM